MIHVVKYFLMVIEVVACLLLIGVILIQKTKGHGMGLAFGAGMGESLFGAQAGNVLTRATVILAVIFLLNTALLALIGWERGTKSVADTIPETGPAVPPSESVFPSTVAGPVDEIPTAPQADKGVKKSAAE